MESFCLVLVRLQPDWSKKQQRHLLNTSHSPLQTSIILHFLDKESIWWMMVLNIFSILDSYKWWCIVEAVMTAKTRNYLKHNSDLLFSSQTSERMLQISCRLHWLQWLQFQAETVNLFWLTTLIQISTIYCLTLQPLLFKHVSLLCKICCLMVVFSHQS